MEKGLYIIIDVCLDYAYLQSCRDHDGTRDNNSAILFSISQFEDTIEDAQKYLADVIATNNEDVIAKANVYITNVSRTHHKTIASLTDLPTNC
jgi:hypothetical protein